MSGPRALRSILEHWRPGHDAHHADPASAISAAWSDAVGPDVARRTRPGRFKDGVLTVYTAASTWSHQLTFLAPTIVSALLERCPDAGAIRLRFIVASGRTKALLDGLGAANLKLPRARMNDADRHADAIEIDANDIEATVARMRRRQHTLDTRREREGWMRCATCGAWKPPTSTEIRQCAVCADEARRAADGVVERVISNAPWLRNDEIATHVPNARASDYRRARRRLLARWEEQLFAATRRLRRGELQAADRVIAWSYIMLSTNMPQHQIGRAVVADALGQEWANALAGPPPERPREATIGSREKPCRTGSRAFTSRKNL